MEIECIEAFIKLVPLIQCCTISGVIFQTICLIRKQSAIDINLRNGMRLCLHTSLEGEQSGLKASSCYAVRISWAINMSLVPVKCGFVEMISSFWFVQPYNYNNDWNLLLGYKLFLLLTSFLAIHNALHYKLSLPVILQSIYWFYCTTLCSSTK